MIDGASEDGRTFGTDQWGAPMWDCCYSSSKAHSVISLFTLRGHMGVFTLKQTERDGREIGSGGLLNSTVIHLLLPLISA